MNMAPAPAEVFEVPYGELRRALRRREQKALQKARERYRYPKRDRRQNHHSLAEQEANRTREFIFWDGETPKDAGYALFGCSKGHYLCRPFLSTQECLELIMEVETKYPSAIHIGFGFNLDVSHILKDIPKQAFRVIRTGSTAVWKDWEIKHIPHKWFEVKRGEVTAKIFDINTFTEGPYVDSLIQFGIGTEEELELLASEKARRPDFLWAEIEEIKEYWALELRLGPQLANAIRQALYDGGQYVPSSWHGPGAVARMALRRHKIYKAMARCPDWVAEAARHAYAGGRVEPFLVGHITDTIFEYDIRSAYPYYATFLPNLARGTWRKGREYEPGKFAIYKISYSAQRDKFVVRPLFRRLRDSGEVVYPERVVNWYWAPEAELVKDDPSATFLEAYYFDEEDESDRPFSFMRDYYALRMRAKKAGAPAAYAYKIIINAIYGQLAQRAGWDRKRNRPPKSHQLEWAGYITSACRAAVYKAALSAGDKLISISTDSVQTLCPLDNLDCGDRLGQWDIKEYSEGIFWQSGIYYLRDEEGEWVKGRTRGTPKGKYGPDDLLNAMRAGTSVSLNRHMFIGYGLALMGKWDQLNTWVDEPYELEFGGNGKRTHRGGPNYCERNCSGDVHRLMNNGDIKGRMAGILRGDGEPDNSVDSAPHYLPWLDGPNGQIDDLDDILVWDIREEDWE